MQFFHFEREFLISIGRFPDFGDGKDHLKLNGHYRITLRFYKNSMPPPRVKISAVVLQQERPEVMTFNYRQFDEDSDSYPVVSRSSQHAVRTTAAH